jgi:ribose transport system ATP-binding protein
VSATQELLRVSGLSKSYAAPVLCDVGFDLRPGEIHALVGENGAGKTTLARIIAGLTEADAGQMHLNSRPYAPADRTAAEQGGVRIVMQELNVIGTLTVAESIFIDRLPNRFGFVDRRRLHADAQELMARLGLDDIEPERMVGSLGVGQQQLVEIAAGLSRRCDLLILDEPTAALTATEVDLLFTHLKALRASGVGIIYISHRLEELRRIADRVTVLRDGKVIGTRQAETAPLNDIIRMMVGRDLSEVQRPTGRGRGKLALRVRNLSRGQSVRDVSFEVREGEILGFAGLMGSGRTETMRAVFGADPSDAGAVIVGDGDTPARIRSPRDAIRHGLALLTEDRKEQGLFQPLPVRVNISLARLRELASLGHWIRSREESAVARRYADALAVRYRSVEQPAAELSGGNQQKVVIARWLYRDCHVLLFDEPTRGIDIGAKLDIYRLLADLADRGKAIVVTSSDLLELFAICDRICVMSGGHLAATFERGDWTEGKVMDAAFSGHIGGHAGKGT